MRAIKILILQDYLRSGGTERQSVALTRAFAAAGHRSTLLTFRPGGSLSPSAGSLDHRSLQPFDLGIDWFAPGLFRRIADLQPDIVLCMGRIANCYAGSIQSRWPRLHVIATLRTGKPLPWLFLRSLRRVRAIIANSRAARDRLVEENALPGSNIHVVYNGLVFPPVLDRNEPLRASLGVAPSTAVFLCVAMFRREKNQRELVETVAGLPAAVDWQLWLAGDGPSRPACERLVRRLKLEGRIKFPGYFSDPSALYSAADVAVHASTRESLSNFLIEAQACGLPAVAYEAQGISECFIPGRTGWEIARGQRESFRSVLANLAGESPALRAPRAAEAREFARETFDPVRQSSAYVELFERFLPDRQN